MRALNNQSDSLAVDALGGGALAINLFVNGPLTIQRVAEPRDEEGLRLRATPQEQVTMIR